MQKFLILKPSSLGDVLHAFPAVSALLKANPGSVADWLISPAFADLTSYVPGVRRNIFFERKKLGKLSSFPATFHTLWKELRAERYDAVIDLQGLARSAFIGRCAKAKIYAGPLHPREWIARICYNRACRTPEGSHAVERNNALISTFLKDDRLDFSFTPPVVERFAEPVKNLLKNIVPGNAETLVSVAPGARWVTKQWPPEFFASVMRKLAEKHSGLHFLLTGSPDEAPLAERILNAVPDLSCSNVCGKTSVGELVELIRNTSLMICNDSGPMHIAAMLSVPVLAFFGPTSPVLTGPYSKKSAVIQPDLPCIFCMKRYCNKGLCHTSLDAEEAAGRALTLLMGE